MATPDLILWNPANPASLRLGPDCRSSKSPELATRAIAQPLFDPVAVHGFHRKRHPFAANGQKIAAIGRLCRRALINFNSQATSTADSALQIADNRSIVA